MSSIGVSNMRAMGQALSGRSGNEIRSDVKKNFGFAGDNAHVNGWAKLADKWNKQFFGEDTSQKDDSQMSF